MGLEYLQVLAKYYEAIWEAMVLPGAARKTLEDMVRMVPDLLRLNLVSDRLV